MKLDKRIVIYPVLALFLLALSGAPMAQAQTQTPTAYDLISAVNDLRASYNLPPYEVNSTLMAIAQAHSDYQASIGQWTHTGADGSRPVDRAMAAGYGGGKQIIVSENVAVVYAGQNYTVSNIIYDMWSDALHWNTMTKPEYTHVGAGVTTVNEVTYYTLDVGYVTGAPGSSSSQPAAPTQSGGIDQWVAPTTAVAILPVQAATPLPDGSIVHTVQYGQVLLVIAQVYGVDIATLTALNNIDPDEIYVGQKLLIRSSFTPTILVPSSTLTPVRTTRTAASSPTHTKLLTAQETTGQPSATGTPTPPAPLKIDRLTLSIIIIVVVGLLGVLAVNFINPREK